MLPPPVIAALGEIASRRGQAVLVLDIDTLERSVHGKLDSLAVSALRSLAKRGVHVALIARHHRARAELLQQSIPGASCIDPIDVDVVDFLHRRMPSASLIAISDSPDLLTSLTDADRGIALGRPELARANIVSVGDSAVRRILWWLLGQRRGDTAS